MSEQARRAVEVYSRLMAVEMLVTEMLANRYLQDPGPGAAARVHRDDWRRVLSEAALPFFDDPALSELAVGEVGDAIDKLIEVAAGMATRRAAERG
jgi:hypothetical protein